VAAITIIIIIIKHEKHADKQPQPSHFALISIILHKTA